MAELEDVDLEEVGEVDEHVGFGLFLAAGDVETYGDDVEALTAFCKLVFDGEGVETGSG